MSAAKDVESGAHDHDDVAASPLNELLGREESGDMGGPQEAQDVLAVLQMLEAVNRWGAAAHCSLRGGWSN